ncbi:dTDP-4-amino-4,6-dideoxygalactose transaminase [Gammaproteobacteria bacterium 45_16_T64]|mgnify:CR=1 FL=1|nr:dTDP-4-amino-4,6-dideoxygalactose transaminase [Gammaproteobacteria bacterium 45_16_T64]
MIEFNKPCYTGNEDQYVIEAMRSNHISGDGPFTLRCQEWFERFLGCPRALLTPSCTHALEMIAILLELKPGDEIIMPSFTFVSTANAFMVKGAKVVFVDIRPDTMNIDEKLIEQAITTRTRAIVAVHYAGVSCAMDEIMAIAQRHDLYVIEDAAQAIMNKHKGRTLGTIGHFATYSFHETKNITSGGEGGLLIINESKFVDRAEIIREKGTNRSQFFRGAIDKYTWVDVGSSYLPSDLQAAYLWGQLEVLTEICENRISSWDLYFKLLKELEEPECLELPKLPSDCTNNGHIFYLKTKDLEQRTALIKWLKLEDIAAVFHYVPLHSSPAGRKFSRFSGTDNFTSTDSERLVRLPIWHGISEDKIEKVSRIIREFYTQ